MRIPEKTSIHITTQLYYSVVLLRKIFCDMTLNLISFTKKPRSLSRYFTYNNGLKSLENYFVVSNFFTQVPIVFLLQFHLYTLLWDAGIVSLQTTFLSSCPHPSINRRRWREGWRRGKEMTSFLLFVLLFLFFLVGVAPKEKAGSSLQFLLPVLASVSWPFIIRINNNESSVFFTDTSTNPLPP